MEVLVLWLAISIAVGAVARSRGRTAIGWALGALFLSPLIALVLVLVLPSRRETLDHRSMQRGTHKKCPSCAELVKAEAGKCRYCGHEFYAGTAFGIRQAGLHSDLAMYGSGGQRHYR